VEKTEQIRRSVPKVLENYGIRSIFDAPCGDFNWMRMLDLTGVDYIGGDIVKALIETNQKKHSSSNKRFIKIDITSDTPPKVDLILCRDLFIHLPLADCQRAVAGFISSDSTYLLATTYIHQPRNDEIKPGAWRPINLQLPPFRFPSPIEMLDDGDANPDLQDHGKCLGLWRISDIQNQLLHTPLMTSA
jgi:hypothetical protein